MAVGDELMKARGVDPTSGSVSNKFDTLSPMFPEYGIDPTTGTVKGVPHVDINPVVPKSSLSGDSLGGEKPRLVYGEGSEEDPSGGFLGDTRERNAANNYGYIGRSLALELASSRLAGPFALGGKMVGMAINGNNVYAVNAARKEMGLEPLTTKEAIEGLVKDRQGIVAEIDIGGKTYAVGLEAKTPNGRTTLTPTEARQRSLVTQNKVVEAPKGTFEKKEKQALHDPTITSQAGFGTRVQGAIQQGIDKVMGREPPKSGPQPATVVSPSFAAPVDVVDRSLLGPVEIPSVEVPSVTPSVTPSIAPSAAPVEIPSVTATPSVTPSIAPTTVAAPTPEVTPTPEVPSAPAATPTYDFVTPDPLTGAPGTPMSPGTGVMSPEYSRGVGPAASGLGFVPDFGTPTQIAGFEPFTVQAPGNTLGNRPAPDVPPSLTGKSPYSPDDISMMTAMDPMGFRAPIETVDFDRMGLMGMPQAAVERAKEYQREVISRGIPDVMVDITHAVRTPEKQAEILSAGNSWTKNSYHLSGMALDISPLDEKNQKGWNDIRSLGRDLGWGLLDPAKDPAHHQLSGYGMTAAQLAALPTDAYGRPVFTPALDLAIRQNAVPTPTARPEPMRDIPVAGTPGAAPQNALNQGFMASQAPGVPQFNPGTIGVQAPNQQLGPTTKDIYGWERPQEVRDLMSLAIAGELGSKTIAGIRSGNPEAIQQARQEIAAIASTIDNRAFSKQYANPADPRTSYQSVLDGTKYNSMMERNMPTTRANYGLVGDFITQALVDYDMGMNPSPVPDATHYRSQDIAAPSWENTQGTQVGEHVFSSSMRADLSGYEYNPSKNTDAFSAFTSAVPDATTDIPDEAFSPTASLSANQGFDTSPRDDKQALDDAMSFSPSPTAMAGTLGSGSLLDEPTTLGIDAMTTFSPDLGTSADKQAKDKESEKDSDKSEVSNETGTGGSEGSSSSSSSIDSTGSSRATGLLSDEGRSGSSGGYSQSEKDAAASGAGLF